MSVAPFHGWKFRQIHVFSVLSLEKKNMVVLSFKGNLLIIRSSQYDVIIKLWIWYKVKFFPSWGLLQIESLRRGLAPFSLSQTFVSALPLPFYSVFWLCWSREGRVEGVEQGLLGLWVWLMFLWVFSLLLRLLSHCWRHSSSIFLIQGRNPPLTYSLWLLLAFGKLVTCLQVLTAEILLPLVVY